MGVALERLPRRQSGRCPRSRSVRDVDHAASPSSIPSSFIVGHVGRWGRLCGFVRVYVVRLWSSLRVVPMAVDPTPLERAFVLAPNWESYRAQIRDQLNVEGYAVSQLLGTNTKQSFVADCSNDRFPPIADLRLDSDSSRCAPFPFGWSVWSRVFSVRDL